MLHIDIYTTDRMSYVRLVGEMRMDGVEIRRRQGDRAEKLYIRLYMWHMRLTV